MFLGYHDPQKWIAVSGGEPGNGNSSLVKFWGKDDSVYTSHTTLSTTNIPAGSWHQLTVTGSEDTLTAYLEARRSHMHPARTEHLTIRSQVKTRTSTLVSITGIQSLRDW